MNGCTGGVNSIFIQESPDPRTLFLLFKEKLDPCERGRPYFWGKKKADKSRKKKVVTLSPNFFFHSVNL